jgi:uncharacterized membrane protein
MKTLTTAVLTLFALSVAASPVLAATLPAGGGGGKNIVIVMNRGDGKFVVRANIQVNREPGPNVQPANVAIATSSCTDCQTLAVALQLNVASASAAIVAPQNAAVATNAGCLRCYTVARAVQYLFTVPDPVAGPPPAADADLRALDRTLRDIAGDPTLTLDDAEARINGVIARFQSIASTYVNTRDAVKSP